MAKTSAVLKIRQKGKEVFSVTATHPFQKARISSSLFLSRVAPLISMPSYISMSFILESRPVQVALTQLLRSEASPSSVSSSAPSSAFSAASTGSTGSTASAHSKSRNAVIIGSVVGGSVFLFGVSSMVFLLWRRSRRWRNLAVEQPFPIDEKEPASPVSNVAEHLRRLEARFRRIETLATILQRSSRRSVPSQSSGRSSPPSYNTGSVS